MSAKKITVPVTPDMAKALDDLCELHALQLPSLASMLLRDALAGRRSALLPKRAAPQNTSEPNNASQAAAPGHGARQTDGLPHTAPGQPGTRP